METQGFGAFIRARREDAGLTQAALAESVGLSKSHLSQIELGKISLPSAEIRRRLAKGLGVTHVELLVAAGELTMEEAGLTGRSGNASLDYFLDQVAAFARGRIDRQEIIRTMIEQERDREDQMAFMVRAYLDQFGSQLPEREPSAFEEFLAEKGFLSRKDK